MEEIAIGTVFICEEEFAVRATSSPDRPWFWCSILPGTRLEFQRTVNDFGWNIAAEFYVPSVAGFTFRTDVNFFKNSTTFA